MKLSMKLLVTCASAMVAVVVSAASAATGKMPRSEWFPKIGEAIKDPELIKTTMAQLSADDQVAYVKAVNERIATLPGAAESKSATFVKVNENAVSGAKGNSVKVLAEIFATVPPENLTDVNEQFAKGAYRRNADPAHPESDETFAAYARTAVSAVVARNAGAPGNLAAVRDTFAILMFVRASGGTPTNLVDQLVALLPAESQAVAKKEWIPAALVDSNPKRYDPMLGAANAGEEPNHVVVSRLIGPQVLDAMLGDLRAETTTEGKTRVDGIGGGRFTSSRESFPRIGDDAGVNRIPRSSNPNDPWYSGGSRNGTKVPVEPHGYNQQT